MAQFGSTPRIATGRFRRPTGSYPLAPVLTAISTGLPFWWAISGVSLGIFLCFPCPHQRPKRGHSLPVILFEFLDVLLQFGSGHRGDVRKFFLLSHVLNP